MNESTNAGHSAASLTAVGAGAAAGFSAGSREHPANHAAAIRLEAARDTEVRILDPLKQFVVTDRKGNRGTALIQ
jgi:hypothetical protein